MTRSYGRSILFLLAVFWLSSLFAQSADLALTGVNIVDARTGQILKNQIVEITGNRISKIGPATIKNISATKQVEFKGKYVIPGLWDMHVHTLTSLRFSDDCKLMLANGVTGFRDTWGDLTVADSARAQMRRGSLPRLRFTVAGQLLDGKDPVWEGSEEIIDKADADRVVDSLAAAGADFIKIYAKLSPQAYAAIVAAAKRNNLAFMGHVPGSVSIWKASTDGMRSIEHMTGVLDGAAADTAALFALQKKRRALAPDDSLARDSLEFAYWKLVVEQYSSDHADALIKHLAANNTWVCPTMVTNWSYNYGQAYSQKADTLLKYVPQYTRYWWSGFGLGDFPAELGDSLFNMDSQLLPKMQAAGVRLLAGTDPWNPWCYPGFSIHDELELFVKSGLSELHALQAATVNPASFMGMTDSLGTIGPGQIANLVVVEGNPLADISNTRNISAVISDGHFYDKRALDQFLNEVDIARNRKPVAPVLLSLLQADNIEQAKHLYHQFLKDSSNYYDVSEAGLTGSGYQLYYQNNTKDALLILRFVVGLFPNSANAYDSVGEVALAAGNLQEAKQAFIQAIEIDKNGAVARHSRKLLKEVEEHIGQPPSSGDQQTRDIE